MSLFAVPDPASDPHGHRQHERRCPPWLVVVEGIYDIHFLQILSAQLHRTQPSLPDLAQLEAQGQIVFLPAGGGDLQNWVERISRLPQPAFHLYDREQEPETSARRQAIAFVNECPSCLAILTKKRALENYLHPQAIRQACGIELMASEKSDAPALLAQRLSPHLVWDDLPKRVQKRLRDKAKKIFNVQAVAYMTMELLQQQDPAQELLGWLQAIAQRVGANPP